VPFLQKKCIGKLITLLCSALHLLCTRLYHLFLPPVQIVVGFEKKKWKSATFGCNSDECERPVVKLVAYRLCWRNNSSWPM